jgi:hypothetical protein
MLFINGVSSQAWLCWKPLAMLKDKLLPKDGKVVMQIGFPIIRECPWKCAKGSFLIYQCEVGVDPVPQVNAMCEILAGGQDEAFFTEDSRVYIDSPFAVS